MQERPVGVAKFMPTQLWRLHADRSPLFRKLFEAKGPPVRVLNTRPSALPSAEIGRFRLAIPRR
jgi:hypothetical protein